MFKLISLTLSIQIFAVTGWARHCSLEEIRQLDTRRIGQDYSPYPLMTKVTLMSSVLPLIPRMDSTGEENSNFWLVNFAGIAGAVYYGMKSQMGLDCEDPRSGGRTYQPTANELLKFHHQEKEMFWDSYLWTSAWMLGVILTSNFSERKAAAGVVLVLPWGFSFSRKWSAFTEDAELDYGFVPMWNGREVVPATAFRFSF